MSSAYKCDRCGTLVEGDKYAYIRAKQYRITTGGHPNVSGKGGELCKDCSIQYIDWWEVRT